jgi:DNA-directed RNA polymerase subunit A'
MVATKKIKNIEFGFLSPEMIRKLSNIEITRAETYDKDGYPIEHGLMDPHLGVISPGLRCKTCGQTMKNCPGHFGSIELIRPIIYPKFSEKLFTVLSCTCKECGRILANPEEIQHILRLGSNKDKLEKEIKSIVKNHKVCPYCNSEIQKVALDKPTNLYVAGERIFPSEVLEWMLKIPDEDKFLFGYSEKLKPEWFVMSVIPVAPVAIRPSLSLENVITSEDDLTYKLLDIVRINIRLQENINAGAPQIIIEDLWDLLQFNVTTYIDNNTAGVPPAKQRSGKPLKTLAQRLKGKKGRFRYNLIGKRVNASARSTITPSVDLKINELGVPEQIAKTLTIPEKITSWNIDRCRKLVKDGLVSYIVTSKGLRKIVTLENKEEISDLLEEGMTIRRNLEDGDLIIFNRQPTLHRTGVMGHYVKVLPGLTFRLNPIACPPYNADFDGDDMNLHCPQSEESYTEIKELMSLEKHVISIRHGEPVITPDHDLVSGSYILTKKNMVFTKKETMSFLYSIGIYELPTADCGRGNYSGKLLFSQILPKDLNLEYKNKICSLINSINPCKRCKKEKCPYDAYFKIENGVLISGILDDNISKHKNLVETIYRYYGPEALIDFYYKYSKLVFNALNKKGLTIALDEYTANENLIKEIKSKVKNTITKSNAIIKKYEEKTLPLIPGKDLEETFESEILKLTSEMKSEVSHEILDIKLKDIFNENLLANNNCTMIASIGGTRGKILNVVNIMGVWGQVTVRKGRPKNGFQDRLLSLSSKKTMQIIDYGFVDNNFYNGLDPKQYFIHAMGGRQGEVDTGVATKVSGYLYRRLSNAMKDFIVDDDLKVVGAGGRIVQFKYGDDALSPDKSYLGKNINFFDE